MLEESVDDWRRVLDVNLTGVMLADQQAAKAMIARGTADQSSTSRRRWQRTVRGAADYCVSKAGVVMLTKAFSLEALEHGIRVNAIGPGFIETAMTNRMNNDAEGAAMMQA
ncbi:MAG: SDR family oxidoreductase [Acidimicrobiales bacterium]